MKPDLEPAKNVLRTFLTEIAEVKKLHQSISAPILAPFKIEDRTPDLTGSEFLTESESFLKEEEAYTWIYAEAWHFRSLMNRPKNSPIPEYYLQPALPFYNQWRAEEKEVFYRGNIIPTPGNISLYDYLQQLAFEIQEKIEKRAVWRKSLKCFAQFIRDDTNLEQQGILECIFPYKMEIRYDNMLQRTENGIQKMPRGYILRNIKDTEYPIDIIATADILKNLAKVILEGRPNSQHNAAEALGFAWLCQAVGSARVQTRECILHRVTLTALIPPDPEKPKNFFQPEYFASIQTFSGFKDIPISKILYDYLIALPRQPGSDFIFSQPISTLLRSLYDQGIKNSERAKSLGKITFLTFMCQATHFFGHRPSHMKKSSKSNTQ